MQGMSDLLSPLLFVMKNEVDAFWCFVGFMDRVASNFEFDQVAFYLFGQHSPFHFNFRRGQWPLVTSNFWVWPSRFYLYWSTIFQLSILSCVNFRQDQVSQYSSIRRKKQFSQIYLSWREVLVLYSSLINTAVTVWAIQLRYVQI